MGRRPELILRCDDSEELTIGVNWVRYLDDSVLFTFGSFDKDSVLELATQTSASGKVIFFKEGRHSKRVLPNKWPDPNPKNYFGIKNKKAMPEHLLRKLLESKRFVVRSLNYRQEQFTAVFDFDGLSDAAARIVADCRVI